MKQKQATEWLQKSENRKAIIVHLKQPMTALQLTKRTGLNLDQCSMLLGQLCLCRLVKCLNPTARRSRLYWLTPIGILCQKKLRNDKSLPSIAKKLPDTNWELYGWLCYSHRAAIIKTLAEPMQPATIKRKAVQQNPQIRMSANNVRDVIKLFLQKGLVRKVIAKRKSYPKYELTQQGTQLKNILTEAGA